MTSEIFDTYRFQMCNTFDEENDDWSKTNVCSQACIYGHDGEKKTASDTFQLGKYQFNVTLDDGSSQAVDYDEFAEVIKVVDGEKMPIRISNQPYEV